MSLDAGPLAICNRYLRDPTAPDDQHPLQLGQCQACGVVQLVNPIAGATLTAPYDWIRYTEPERHLDALAEEIAGLPGVSPDAPVLGVSSKDDTLLQRLQRKGFRSIARLDGVQDLGGTQADLGMELVQERLTPERAAAYVRRHGVARVVILRHVLEHVQNMPSFAAALATLTDREGYLVVESPDCRGGLEARDYCMLWEEHVYYFTAATFSRALYTAGFNPLRVSVVPLPLENSAVAIVRPAGATRPPPPALDLASEMARGRSYAQDFLPQRQAVQRHVQALCRQHGKLAVFGSGHQAGMYINAMQIAPWLAFVVDDNPNKQQMFMPGSRLAVVDSAHLAASDVRYCLLAVNPENEDALIGRQQVFLARGGEFASIFPSSPRALRIAAGESRD
ncbi:MAG: class I SAM-dependent methyltransferase [Lentisphaerae bacterium]|nr:class I SAM-dependent methyltransferase [Lentisphaerota bacterium]